MDFGFLRDVRSSQRWNRDEVRLICACVTFGLIVFQTTTKAKIFFAAALIGAEKQKKRKVQFCFIQVWVHFLINMMITPAFTASKTRQQLQWCVLCLLWKRDVNGRLGMQKKLAIVFETNDNNSSSSTQRLDSMNYLSVLLANAENVLAKSAQFIGQHFCCQACLIVAINQCFFACLSAITDSLFTSRM